MTAVARPPGTFPLLESAAPTVHSDVAASSQARLPYVGRHRRPERARHVHAAAAMLALMLVWIPAAGGGNGRHRRRV